jgi:hypothetical protein
VLDDVVHLWLCSDAGDQFGLLASENPAVREWTEAVVDDHLADARPLGLEMERSSRPAGTAADSRVRLGQSGGCPRWVRRAGRGRVDHDGSYSYS